MVLDTFSDITQHATFVSPELDHKRKFHNFQDLCPNTFFCTGSDEKKSECV